MSTLKAAAAQAEMVPTQATATEAPQRDAAIAFGLLDRAATALPALLERCRKLKADLDVAEESTREWQQNAATLKSKLEAAENSLEAIRLRVQVTADQAAAIKQEAAQSQHRAAKAEAQTSLLHDKVIAALGLGSAAHEAFDALQMQGVPITKG